MKKSNINRKRVGKKIVIRHKQTIFGNIVGLSIYLFDRAHFRNYLTHFRVIFIDKQIIIIKKMQSVKFDIADKKVWNSV